MAVWIYKHRIGEKQNKGALHLFQWKEKIVDGVMVEGGGTITLSFDGMGITTPEITKDTPYSKQCMLAMEGIVKDSRGKILGPFETRVEALDAYQREREKSPQEQVEIQNAEITSLKVKLAAIQKDK